MKRSTISRKKFLTNTAIGLAALSVPFASSLNPTQSVVTAKTLNPIPMKLKNVRLETGFLWENQEVVGTETALFLVELLDGKIKSVSPNQADADAFDAKGYLMLPSFRDMHIHLDKTLFTEPWRAVRRSGGIKGMIAYEQKIMPDLLQNSTYKAEKLIELLQRHGTAFARSHVNIEPTSKLDALKNLEIALENKKQSFGAEIVAFPQHGLFYTDSLQWMREAAQMNIDFIGGLDPTSVDGSLQKTLDATVQLALDYQKGIDIHLHETGKSGLETVDYLIEKVHENPVLKGKTYISHAFVLRTLQSAQQEAVAERLADAQIGIASTVPLGNSPMPIPLLLEKGVEVLLGNDSIVDHWNTFGTGSVLQKANLAAQLYGQASEFGLSRMLKLATAGPIPLDQQGQQQWPKVGDVADLVLMDASCSAEAVARISPVKSLIYKGKFLF